jgi:hypothetical protein
MVSSHPLLCHKLEAPSPHDTSGVSFPRHTCTIISPSYLSLPLVLPSQASMPLTGSHAQESQMTKRRQSSKHHGISKIVLQYHKRKFLTRKLRTFSRRVDGFFSGGRGCSTEVSILALLFPSLTHTPTSRRSWGGTAIAIITPYGYC